MKWTNSNSSTNISNSSPNGTTTTTNGTIPADKRQSIFYTTSETTIPINSPPIVILDQKFNGVSGKSSGINELKTKDTMPSIVLNGSHLLESSTDPVEMGSDPRPTSRTSIKSKQSFLRKRVQNIGVLDYELERKCREQQLSKVLRALLFVESKLRSEQMIIRKQLCEKDDVINRQMCTIKNLKRKYGELEESGEEKGGGEAAQFCPKCRKNYYLYESKSIAIQTSDISETRDEELNNENSSIQSVEYMSSSEEADSFNSFLGARRSRKYTSKRSFKDYFTNKTNRDISSSERSFYSESNTTNKHDSDKENNLSESNYGSTGTESVYSNFINNMHGIKSPTSPVKSILNETFSSTSSKTEGFDETVIYGNNAKESLENGQDCEASQKYTKDMEVKQGVEPSEDWYASNSDMEEGTENRFSKVYGQSAGNPVLDCVNQILLQGNNDDFNDKEDSPITPSRTPSTPRSKRVHFSNQNTIHTPNQIASRAPYPIMEQDETSQQSQHFHYDVPLQYTNDYEQLGSSNHYVDMESKVGSDDMGIELLTEKEMMKRGIKTPPALPPKPANLIRLQKQLNARPARIVLRSPNSKGSPSTVTGDGSEPDYCSISDVKETKTVQIVAEIHKEDCSNDYSSVNNENQVNSEEDGDSEELEESFEDVPKLPMVQEIVPPKKKDMNKFIGLDNYITKSPYKYQAIRSSMTNRQKIAQILAEITKSSPTVPVSNRTSPSATYDSPVNIPIVSPMSEIIDSDTNEHLHHQQQQQQQHKSAFDWYIKEPVSKRPSIIHEESPENEENENDTNSPVPDNMDNSSEKVERPSDPITQDPIFYSGDEAEDFRRTSTKQTSLFKNMITLAETPAKLKGDKNYQFFLENSGLSSKPILPRKKRVFYTEPFV